MELFHVTVYSINAGVCVCKRDKENKRYRVSIHGAQNKTKTTYIFCSLIVVINFTDQFIGFCIKC